MTKVINKGYIVKSLEQVTKSDIIKEWHMIRDLRNEQSNIMKKETQ